MAMRYDLHYCFPRRGDYWSPWRSINWFQTMDNAKLLRVGEQVAQVEQTPLFKTQALRRYQLSLGSKKQNRTSIVKETVHL